MAPLPHFLLTIFLLILVVVLIGVHASVSHGSPLHPLTTLPFAPSHPSAEASISPILSIFPTQPMITLHFLAATPI